MAVIASVNTENVERTDPDPLPIPPHLAALSNAFGPSGAEGEVRSTVLSALQTLDMKTESKTESRAKPTAAVDSMGNLVLSRPGHPGSPTVLLAAHMDEVGLLITGHDDNGLLRFKTLGGIDPRVLIGRSLHIGTTGLVGVIGQKPIHLLEPSERGQAPKTASLRIDIGTSSADEARGFAPLGTSAVFATQFAPFGEDKVWGKALDDRVGCSLLIDLLAANELGGPAATALSADELGGPAATALSADRSGEQIEATIYAAFTVQEEVGLRGARIVAERLADTVDFALVLEATTCADLPGVEPHEQATALGAGPVLTVIDGSAVASPVLLSRLIEAAEHAGIPWQTKRTTFGGTDAGRIHLAGGGIPTAVIAVPCRYIHSPAAVMDLNDYYNTLRLLRSFLSKLHAERVDK